MKCEVHGMSFRQNIARLHTHRVVEVGTELDSAEEAGVSVQNGLKCRQIVSNRPSKKQTNTHLDFVHIYYHSHSHPRNGKSVFLAD